MFLSQRVQAANSLELQAEVIVRPALALIEEQEIGGDWQRGRELLHCLNCGKEALVSYLPI